MTKVCKDCQVEKPITDYYLVRGKPRQHCKLCAYAKTKLWHQQNKDKVEASRTKNWHKIRPQREARRRERYKETPELFKDRELKRKYNMSLVDYEQLLKNQGNACAICQRDASTQTKRLAVDHSHKTGKVRGLLCELCNRGLGLFKDDPLLIERAIEYLESFKTSQKGDSDV